MQCITHLLEGALENCIVNTMIVFKAGKLGGQGSNSN